MEAGRTTDGRQRLLTGAISLLRERGLSGASFGEVVKRTGAPRGSIYHHFPGGKQQLMVEAVDLVGVTVDGLIAQSGDDPRKALQAFVSAWRSQLSESDFRAGCPVVGVAAELGDQDEALATATARAFGRWTDRFAGVLLDQGLGKAAANRIATLVVAAVEGAVILSRARRSTEPLEDIGLELDRFIAAGLEGAAAPRDPAQSPKSSAMSATRS